MIRQLIVIFTQLTIYYLPKMSQSNSHIARNLTPSRHHPQAPTKTHILQWIHSLLPDLDQTTTTIESLGNGATYCRLINHYSPNSILQSRILTNPLNEYESCLNLKQLQLTLSRLRIPIVFEINKVSKQRYAQNWNLISSLFKHLQGNQVRKVLEESIINKRCTLEVPKIQPPKILNQNCNKVNEESKITPQKSEIFARGGSLVHMIDRIKEILISNANDSYKIQLISNLFGVGKQVKVEEPEQQKKPNVKK